MSPLSDPAVLADVAKLKALSLEAKRTLIFSLLEEIGEHMRPGTGLALVGAMASAVNKALVLDDELPPYTAADQALYDNTCTDLIEASPVIGLTLTSIFRPHGLIFYLAVLRSTIWLVSHK